MTHIILTEEQMKVVRQARTAVQVCDPQGIVPGRVELRDHQGTTTCPKLTAELISKITWSEDQKKQVFRAISPVEVCDPRGMVLGTADPEQFPGFIAEMKRRASAPGPRYSGEQVRQHLDALEEAWDREGGFDEARMREILADIREREKA